MKTLALLVAVAALAACTERAPDESLASPAQANKVDAVATGAGDGTGEPAADEATPEAPLTEADYFGRWTGVEGMYLVVAPKPGGGVTLEMQWDLDHKGTFEGSVTAEGLRFLRDGEAETAVPTRGDATGLKYLAGKEDCLTVRPGEGYCRDPGAR